MHERTVTHGHGMTHCVPVNRDSLPTMSHGTTLTCASLPTMSHCVPRHCAPLCTMSRCAGVHCASSHDMSDDSVPTVRHNVAALLLFLAFYITSWPCHGEVVVNYGVESMKKTVCQPLWMLLWWDGLVKVA